MGISVEDTEISAAKAMINEVKAKAKATTSTISVEGARKVMETPVGTTVVGRALTAVGAMESEAMMTEEDTRVLLTRQGMVADLPGMITEGATVTLLGDMTKVAAGMTTVEVTEALQIKAVEDMITVGATEALLIKVMADMITVEATEALLVAMTIEKTMVVHLADTTKAAVATIIEEATGRLAMAVEEPTMTARADTLEVHTMIVRVAGTAGKITAVTTAVLAGKATAVMAEDITDKTIVATVEMEIEAVTTVDKITEVTEGMGIETMDKIIEVTEEVGIEAETIVVTASKMIAVEETEAGVAAVAVAVVLEEAVVAGKKGLAPDLSPVLDTSRSATRSQILVSKTSGVAELVPVRFMPKIPICSNKCRFVVAPGLLERVKLCG
ncbi:hypothetical protein P3T76_002540 [Phytophthora citrophthora]|uniref:Uncharacterized protein n=1 Tax=Phytophthora citrophthora TaxID=4793 RepID=A0AAD9GVR5_9STRA|nr:hypothetical protein P3T76_002540 [Phytophthora citrophthora]